MDHSGDAKTTLKNRLKHFPCGSLQDFLLVLTTAKRRIETEGGVRVILIDQLLFFLNVIDRNYNQYVSLLESLVPLFRSLNRLGVAVVVTNPSSSHFLNVNPKDPFFKYQPHSLHSSLPVPWEGTPDLTIQVEESVNAFDPEEETSRERQYTLHHHKESASIYL